MFSGSGAESFAWFASCVRGNRGDNRAQIYRAVHRCKQIAINNASCSLSQLQLLSIAASQTFTLLCAATLRNSHTRGVAGDYRVCKVRRDMKRNAAAAAHLRPIRMMIVSWATHAELMANSWLTAPLTSLSVRIASYFNQNEISCAKTKAVGRCGRGRCVRRK